MKQIVRLTRVHHDKDGTFGIMVLEDGTRFLTVEPEQKGNVKNISCIPTGQYNVDHEPSPKYGHAYWVKDVPNRNYIKIHSGNNEDASNGCIIIGLKSGLYNGKQGVLCSSEAIILLENKLNNESFTLIIKENY